MILHITDQRMLREIQIDFSKQFPYLRIEFFTPSHHNNTPAKNVTKIDPYIRAGVIRKKHFVHAVNVFPDTSVKEFEQMMRDDFNADVQVYHYTKAGWLQTDVTDIATLDELNDQGRRDFNELHNTAAQSKNLY
jgi:hypothetical protein